MKKILLFTTTLILLGLTTSATTIDVVNKNNTGAGSLRQAAIDAASGDTIRFSSSLLTSAVDSISLATEIDFGNKGIIIKGLYTATDTLFISGANSSRIFSFHGAGKVVLDSLVLINGNGIGATLSGSGGAVSYYSGTDTLHIIGTVIKNNTASTNGGGVHSTSSSITVNNSTISNNTANSHGGGIHSHGTPSITVNNSTISNNTTTNGSGGGIYSYNYSSSTVTVNNSTISNNTAGSSGGAVYWSSYSSYSSVTVNNSTISNNTASSSGGGVYSASSSASSYSSVAVNNSTISNNTAYQGGGIRSYSTSSSSVTIGSSIFFGSSIYNQGLNSITSNGYNVFSDSPTGATGTDDQTNVSPGDLNLQSLAFNGGTTQTMLPGVGSFALNMGDPSDMTDAQNHSISDLRRDVGAAEYVCQLAAGTHIETVCSGESITVNGTVYDVNNLTGTEIFMGVGSNYCDSTVVVTITIGGAIDVTTTTANFDISANQAGATYQWIDCDNANAIIPSETNQSYTATVNGNYAVIVSENGCTDTSACVNIATVGIDNLGLAKNGYQLFPNPTTAQVTISNFDLSIDNITIVDVTGKMIQSFTPTTAVIDVSMLQQGIYFVKIQHGNEIFTQKMVKQ